MSNENPDYTTGDLIFVLKTMPHPIFNRKKNDLYMKLVVNLTEALSNITRTISHLDNHKVDINFEGPVQPGDIRKISGEGMPIHESASQTGDLFVEVGVKMPSVISDSQRESNTILYNNMTFRTQEIL